MSQPKAARELLLNYTQVMRVFHSAWHYSYESAITVRKNTGADGSVCIQFENQSAHQVNDLVNRLPVIGAVPVHWNEPAVRHGTLYTQRLLRLHAARRHAAQRHCLLVWLSQGC